MSGHEQENGGSEQNRPKCQRDPNGPTETLRARPPALPGADAACAIRVQQARGRPSVQMAFPISCHAHYDGTFRAMWPRLWNQEVGPAVPGRHASVNTFSV